jgi:hypothetical protein
MSTLHSGAFDLEKGTRPNPATRRARAAPPWVMDVAIQSRLSRTLGRPVWSTCHRKLPRLHSLLPLLFLFFLSLESDNLIFFSFLAPLAACQCRESSAWRDPHLRGHRVLAAGCRRIFTFWGSFCVHLSARCWR